jgi:hypothetical protein
MHYLLSPSGLLVSATLDRTNIVGLTALLCPNYEPHHLESTRLLQFYVNPIAELSTTLRTYNCPLAALCLRGTYYQCSVVALYQTTSEPYYLDE